MTSEFSGAPPRPWAFLVVVIVVAIAVSALIGYLGVTGQIGAGIPGTHPGGHSLTTLPRLLEVG